ncbi:MAG: J domain-containing protein [Lachnospiraceae bacterium]|nr:J domain-containing protein [Lachnospiraceae bacterium]
MDIAKDITVDDLAAIRFWLMQESKKLEIDRANLEREREAFEAEKQRFNSEKQIVADSVNNRDKAADLEAKTIAYQKMLVERKLAILENGFKELCRDKEAFEKEKEEFERNKKNAYSFGGADDAGVLFNGVDNFLALKKRYRDLLKIFHPDNLSGDKEALQIINDEYAKLKDIY